MSLFLIQNSGRYKAKDVTINFILLPDYTNTPIKLGDIEPGKGYVFVAGFAMADTQEPFGTRLTPKDLIMYTDEFSNEKREIKIRSPYSIPRIIAPGIHWMR